MITGIMLLYVGATLGINGIWLIGQARVAAATTAGNPAPENHFTFMQPKEIAVINFFTAGVGVVVATLFAVMGATQNNLAYVANAAYVMLFGFTYLFLAINQLINAGNRAFGWFCFFVAVTAIPTGFFTLGSANGNAAVIWLGINWFIWGCLWFCFFLLLTMERPIMRPVGWATVAVAVTTCWAFGFVILQGVLAF